MSDQVRIFPYNIRTISVRISTISGQYKHNISTISVQYQYNIMQTSDESKEKYQLEDY